MLSGCLCSTSLQRKANFYNLCASYWARTVSRWKLLNASCRYEPHWSVEWKAFFSIPLNFSVLVLNFINGLSNLRYPFAQIVSRKGKPDERRPLLLLFGETPISAVFNAADQAVVGTLSEHNYRFLKTLTQVRSQPQMQFIFWFIKSFWYFCSVTNWIDFTFSVLYFRNTCAKSSYPKLQFMIVEFSDM